MYTLSDYVAMIEEGNNTVILFNRIVDLIYFIKQHLLTA